MVLGPSDTHAFQDTRSFVDRRGGNSDCEQQKLHATLATSGQQHDIYGSVVTDEMDQGGPG